MHKINNKQNDPPNKYKEYFEYLRRMLSDWKTDLAAYGITGQSRHLFGPDAIYTSATLSVSPIAAGFSGAVGHIHILYGRNAGLSLAINVSSLGLMWQGASTTADLTKLYYSGSTTQFNQTGFNAFYGKGYELSMGFGAYGLSGSLNFSYASSTFGNFTIGVGGSFGIGTPGPGGSVMQTDTKKW